MGSRRAVTLAGTAILGVGVWALPAGAHGPADDYVPYQPSGFFVYDWSGPYAGGNLGLAHTNAEAPVILFPDASVEPGLGATEAGLDITGAGAGQGATGAGFGSGFAFDVENSDQSETSVIGGVQAGWQKQWGRLVAGGEVGFSLHRFDTTKEALADLFRSVEARDVFLLTGRLGYADGRWLAYAKGGLASADIDVSYDDTRTGQSTSSGGREIGWTAGVGIDYALTYNLILGVEYNYVHFRSDVGSLTLPNFPEAEFSDVDVDIQNVVVRLNYRFNAPCCIGPGGY